MEEKQNEEELNENAESQNEEIKQNEEQVLYEREDSETGYAKNLTEATMLKANRKYEVFANKLLGNFDDNGHYAISDEILTELTLLKKIIGLKTENGMELKAFYKNLSFEFLLKFNGLSEDKTSESATLFLIERIEKVNGYIVNKMVTPVATFSAQPSENFGELAYQAFHVVKKVDDASPGCIDGNAFNIDKRIAYLLAVREASKNAYVELEEIYFNTRLSILDSIPQGTLILSEFAKKRALLEQYFINNDRNKFRALNELLTSILEANPSIMAQMPVFDVMITPLNNKYLNATIAISQKIKVNDKYLQAINTQPEIVQPTPVGGGGVKIASGGKKPSAPKPSGGKKKGGPKKSGGGGGGKGGGKGGDSKKKGKDKKKDSKPKIVVAKVDFKPQTQTAPEKETEKKEPTKKYALTQKDGEHIENTDATKTNKSEPLEKNAKKNNKPKLTSDFSIETNNAKIGVEHSKKNQELQNEGLTGSNSSDSVKIKQDLEY